MKKLLISIILIWLVTFTFAGPALAAGKQPGNKQSRVQGATTERLLGQVTAVGTQEFKLKGLRDQERSFAIDEKTLFFTAGGELKALNDLKTGQWLLVQFQPQGKPPLARLTLFLPEGFDPAEWQGQHLRSKLSQVDVTAGQFTLETARGWQKTVSVTATTHFLDPLHSLADLKPGMIIEAAIQTKAGKPVATALFAHPPLDRAAGTLQSVDATAHSFILKTVKGETVTVKTATGTRLISQEAAVKTLADLKPGRQVIVFGKKTAEGPLMALVVIAGQNPQEASKFSGKIKALAAGSFTVQDRQGQERTFQVTPQTTFRGRQVNSLSGLKTGMLILVLYEEQPDGQYLARTVRAGQLAKK